MAPIENVERLNAGGRLPPPERWLLRLALERENEPTTTGERLQASSQLTTEPPVITFLVLLLGLLALGLASC